MLIKQMELFCFQSNTITFQLHVQCQCLHFGIFPIPLHINNTIHITPLDECLKNVQASKNF
jgi:hypothetical protein